MIGITTSPVKGQYAANGGKALSPAFMDRHAILNTFLTGRVAEGRNTTSSSESLIGDSHIAQILCKALYE